MKKSGLYTKYKSRHDRTSPYTNTYIYTYHRLLTTFNEQSKQVSSKLRLVFRIIHGSYPGEGTGYHDVFSCIFLSLSLSLGKAGMVPWSRRMFYFLFTHIITSFQEIQSQITPALNAESLNGPWTQFYTGFRHTTPHTPGVNVEVLWRHHNSTSYIEPIEEALETDRCGTVNTAIHLRQYGTMTSMYTAI